MRMRNRQGMSILEVMVAIAVLLVMTIVSWEVLSSTIEIREFLSRRDDSTRGARVAMSTIKRDIQSSFLTTKTTAINSYYTVFVGADDDPDMLHFATLSHQRLYRDSRESDQTEITLWAEQMPDNGEGYVLYHREAPRIDEEPDEDGTIYPIAYNVRSFNLRYLDSVTGEWFDEWDSRGVDQLGRLPRAVQIGLVLLGPDPEDEDRMVELPYLTTVLLTYAPKLQQSLFADGGGG